MFNAHNDILWISLSFSTDADKVWSVILFSAFKRNAIKESHQFCCLAASLNCLIIRLLKALFFCIFFFYIMSTSHFHQHSLTYLKSHSKCGLLESAEYLGIPQKYYELMRTDAPELLAYNANYWFSQKNELRTLRTMDGCARAFLSNRYRRIDNLDIASVTLPVIGELPEARFVSTQITEDFMYIKVVNPRLQADVVPGDVVQAGDIISNSETGLGSVTIQPLIYRLVCSNGMVINDAKTRRNHVGRAATSEEDFSIYSNETLLADDHAFVLKIKDTVRAAISEARFAQAVSRMRESTEAMLDTKQLPAIVKLASSSFGITEDESNGVLEHLITGGDFSLYGLANAVTRFSQDVESYDRATKLEEIGYSVMTMSPALFRQMNRTELLAA